MLFEQPVHVNCPNIGDRKLFYAHIDSMFDRRWLTNGGELVRQLEQELQRYLGVRHCVAVSSGTVALQLAFKALGLSGEVIIPSLTFIATAHALQWLGITPVFCDVDPQTLCIDPALVGRQVTPKTTGMVGVHVYGHTCDTDALQGIAAAHGLKLMYDAAHAFGNQQGGRRIGGFGECEVHSFHATKIFNTFEGGAITTDSDELAHRLRQMRNFGFSDYDRVDGIGINAKMTEAHAAMGLANLHGLDGFLKANQANYQAYADGFAAIPGLRLVPDEGLPGDARNHQYILVEVEDAFPLSRDELMRRLHAENVLVRRYFWPGCHRMEPYRTLQPDAGRHLPVTEAFLDRVLVFPTGSAVTPDMVQKIIKRIQSMA